MAEEKKRKSSALARLMPSIEIKDQDGATLSVPVGPAENRIANMILAAQIRRLMQSTIQKYADMDKLTPKELKDLADAGRSLAEFSGEVYKGESIEEPTGEKRAEPAASESLDFGKLKPKEETVDEN